jgi:hypothetical protein
MAQPACDICNKNILIPSPDFPQLCAVCGRKLLETIRAVAELSIEMAEAYGVNLLKQGFSKLPGVSIEEIELRMQLNRIKETRPGRFQEATSD